MQPSGFEQANAIADTPPGVDPDAVSPLNICRVEFNDGTPGMISCWKPTADELAEIMRTGRVWLTILGRVHPPVAISGFCPFSTLPSPPA